MPVYTIEVPNGQKLDIEADDESSALDFAGQWYEQNVTSKTAMRRYTIELPDRRKIDIESPDEQTALQDAEAWFNANPKQEAPSNTSVLGGLHKGVSDVVGGVGKTLKNYVSEDAGKAVEATGDRMAPRNYRSATDQFSQPDDGPDNHFMGRDWSKLPRAVVESAPGMAADMLVGTLGKRLLGPAGLLLGAGASYMGRTAGGEAEKRAEGRTGEAGTTPTTTDKAIGLGSTAAQAALNAYGVNKIINPGRIAATGAAGVAQAAGNVGKAAVAEGATNMAQEAISQGASTAGTDKGLRFDTRQLVDSGILGAATGGAFGGAKGAKDASVAARYRDIDTSLQPHAASVANRIVTHAGSPKALQDTATAYKATTAAQSDVTRELTASASALRKLRVLDVDAENALSRAESGAALSGSDMRALDKATGGVSGGDATMALVRQLQVIDKLKSKGDFDAGNERFGGGIANKVSKLATSKGFLSTGGALGGGFAGSQGGMGPEAIMGALGSAATPMAIAGGAYAATKLAERGLGIASPARAFAEKFADPSVPVRPESAPYSPPEVAPNQSSAPATSVPQFPPRKLEPWGKAPPEPDASASNAIIDQGMMTLAKALAKTGSMESVNPVEAPQIPDAAKSAMALAKVMEHQRARDYASMSDAEVAAKATQEAVDAGKIPDQQHVRAAYAQGVHRKRNAIRAAAKKVTSAESFTEADAEAFQPFFDRLMVARGRDGVWSILSEAQSVLQGRVTANLVQAFDKHTINSIWRK